MILKRLQKFFNKKISKEIQTFQDYLSDQKKITRSQITSKEQLKQFDKGNDEQQISLKYNYLYGFEKQDFEGLNPLLQEVFSLDKATPGQLLNFKKQKSFEKYQNHFLDVGSPVLQVVSMTEQILHNFNHIKQNKKDYKAIRKLEELFNRRKKMLNYIRLREPHKYIWIVREFGIQQSQKKLDCLRMYKVFRKSHCANSRKSFKPSDNLKTIKNPRIMRYD